MNVLLKQKSFWIATALFMLISLAIIWLALPPALSAIQDTRSQLSQIDSQISVAQIRLDAGKTLKENSAQLQNLYNSAVLALPESSDTDQLMLQLEGLISDLKLDATLTLPLSSASATTASTPVITSNDNIQPGGAGSSGSSSAQSATPSGGASFTVNGKYGFSSTRELLSALKYFSRWNKISSVSLAVSGDSSTSTVTAQVFSSDTKPAEFSGTATDFIQQAQQVFSSLVSYATVPSVDTEGNFGRTDPFSQL